MCDCLNFDKQLDEVRCICAIYPDQVIIEDKEVKKIVFSESNLANGTPQQSKQYHNHPIDFYYICKDKKGCVQYETYFSIDKDYPATKLDSHVRIYNRPKQTQTAINNQLATLISSKSDVDVFTVIVWINERMEDLDHVHLTISEEPENTTSLVPSSSSLTTSTTISTNSSGNICFHSINKPSRSSWAELIIVFCIYLTIPRVISSAFIPPNIHHLI